MTVNVKKRLCIAGAGLLAACLALYGVLERMAWDASWGWFSQHLAGRFLAEDSDVALPVIWTGMWKRQRFAADGKHETGWAGWTGDRLACATFRGREANGEIRLVRSLAAPKPGETPFAWGSIRLGGQLPGAFPLLRQVDVLGGWQLALEGEARPPGTFQWSGTLELQDARFEFGPADRESPAGSIALEKARAAIESEGATFRFTEIDGHGNGVRVSGKGSVVVAGKPGGSVIDILLTVYREPGTQQPVVPGWEGMLEGAAEIEVAIRGTVDQPEFLVNGFALVREVFEPRVGNSDKIPPPVGDLTQRLAAVAAERLAYSREQPTVVNGTELEPQPFEGLSDTDITKIRRLVAERLKRKPEDADRPEPSAAWRSRRKELKDAYKKEFKKIEEAGMDLREEFGKKPKSRLRELIEEQLSEEFPEEAEQLLGQE